MRGGLWSHPTLRTGLPLMLDQDHPAQAVPWGHRSGSEEMQGAVERNPKAEKLVWMSLSSQETRTSQRSDIVVTQGMFLPQQDKPRAIW